MRMMIVAVLGGIGLVSLSGCGAPKQAMTMGPHLAGEQLTVVEFDAENAQINYDGPHDTFGLTLASEIASELRRRGFSVNAVRASETPEGAAIVRGRISRVDGGSRGLRFWIGFAAGAAKFGVEGEVVRPDGTQLASFKDERWSSGMGNFGGGNSEELIQKCLRQVGRDIAEMIDTGQYGQ